MTQVVHAYTSGRPLLPVVVNVGQARLYGLANAGRPVPRPVDRVFLIDTGAVDTWVDRDTVTALALLPFNTVPVQTGALGTAVTQFEQYDIGLRIRSTAPGRRDFEAGSVPALCGDFGGQGIDGLLGRDVLARCTARFDGRGQRFTLTF